MAGYHGWSTWEFDEERDFKASKLWIWDKKESYAVMTLLDMWVCMDGYAITAFQYGAERLSIPTTKGVDYRTKDGWLYIAVIMPSEEERKKREPIFRERIAPWIDDYSKEWGKFTDELMGYYEQFKAVDVEKLEDIELRQHLRDWIPVYRKNGICHFIAMYAQATIMVLFEDMCQELLGIDRHDPVYNRLMAGFDNRVFQTARGLWQLAGRVSELGLEQLFHTIQDDEQLLSELEESEAGKKWLQELREFLWSDGWRTEANWFISIPSWVEKPALALPSVRQALGMGGVFVLEQARARLTKEREEAEKETLSRIPEERREWFAKLMRSTQLSTSCNEGHQFYCENYGTGIWRRITKEIGRRFALAGIIDDPQDVYWLLPEEIDMRMIPKLDARKWVQIRKEQHQEFRKTEPPLFIGDPSLVPVQLVADPFLTTRIIAEPRVKPELKADLYGAASAPGVVEGTARFITSESEFSQVQPGEILVTVETSPIWTPLFGIVNGVVTDVGGAVSHAIIVGREFGLPVVAGTHEGSKKIRTGMRIRVDGDMCAVYILE